MTANTLTDFVELATRRVLSLEMHGPQYAAIVAYEPPPIDRARVQPLVAPVGPDGIPRLAPVLGPLPVAWPRSGGGSFTWPLVPGDVVRLVPLDHDHATWITNGSKGQAPGSGRRWDLTDSIVEPFAVGPKGGELAADTYSANGPVLAGRELFLISALAADFVALASKVDQELTAIKGYIDAMTMTAGTLVAPPGGGAVTGLTGVPSSPMPTPGPTGSTKIHGE